MGTTFRADLIGALMAILNAQKVATPNLLRQVDPVRPGSFKELPAAYIGPRSETVTHDSGTRTRTFTGLTVVVVDAYNADQTGADNLDVLVDALLDTFDVHLSQIPGTLIEVTAVTDTEVVVTSKAGVDIIYPGVVFSLARTAIKEGRQ